MGRQLIIDRFEGTYAICEEIAKEGTKGTKEPKESGKKAGKNGKEVRFFGIEKAELPENAKEGSVLAIDEDGNLTVESVAMHRISVDHVSVQKIHRNGYPVQGG